MGLKIRRLIFILMFFLLFLPINAKASCTYSELANLKKIASNLNISYVSAMENGKPKFYVVFNNLNTKLYIVDTSTNNIFNNTSTTNNELVLDYFKEGTRNKIDVYSNDITCTGELLYSTYVVLPSYNIYYGNNICKGIENYSLCQKWVTHTMTYKEFKIEIDKYKESLIVEEEQKKINSITLIDKITNFVIDNHLIISVSILLIIITIIIIKYVTRDRFKYLE